MVNKVQGHETRLLAMLIDGDNAQPSLIEHVLAEAAKYGVVTTRRIYGDWTEPQMSGWKDSLHSLAVQPVQQFRYTVGKNATDSALIIEAMDLLHSGSVGGFCIVSSDSDYTRLGHSDKRERDVRDGGGAVEHTKVFSSMPARSLFTRRTWHQRRARDREAEEKSKPEWIPLVAQAIDMASQDDGWSLLAAVGSNLQKLNPAFDSRSYGHKAIVSIGQVSTGIRLISKGSPPPTWRIKILR